MTKIQIDEIHFKNFKNFADMTLTLNGNDAVVSGRNGAGKTSLSDGFQWLLFGKDTFGAKLNPKPLDAENQEKLGLNPTIEAQLIIDGKPITLTRIQEEKWSTKRGELEAVRASDTTKYFVDGVPTKERDWKEYLENLGGESLLQMLSNSAFFMTLNWAKRREILMEMSGVTDESIIENNPDLQELKNALGDKSIDDLKKILKARKKDIISEIEGLPARIQENTDTIASIKERIGDVIALEAESVHYTQELAKAQEHLARVKNGDAALDYQQELANLRLKLTEEKNRFLSSEHLATKNLQDDVNTVEEQLRKARNECSDIQYKITSLENLIADKKEFKKRLIAEYHEINSLHLDEHAKDCPTCKQELPQDQLVKLIEDFNVNKSNKLEVNKQKGVAKKVLKEDLQADAAQLKDLQESAFAKALDVEGLTIKLETLRKELAAEKSRQGTFEETKTYKKITEQVAIVQQKITNATKDISAQIHEAQEEANSIIAKLSEVQAKIQEQKTVDGLLDRINDLKKKDADLKQQNSEVERQLWLIDEFTRIKVSSIEDSINQKFEQVKWKLFDVQKNGAIAEMCEATFNGVEYNSGLNNGARINCDLDIINTLSKQFGVSLPVFVDNAESVNELLPIDSQLIELQVTEDETLKVEL